VLVELPLAMSYTGGAALADLGKRRGVTVMVAHTQRYMPAVRAVRDEVAAGRLHVHHVLARFLFFRRRNVGWTGRVRSWADNLLWHHSCHMVDTCLWVLGMPPVDGLAVRGRIGPSYPATGIPMDLDISMATPAGTLVNIGMSYHSEDTGLDFLFVGEERTLHVAEHTLLHRGTVLYDAAAHHEYIANELQDREFFAALTEGRQPDVTPFDSA
jgi:2-hydroxy-4-carboxymuconate semialdehyde hemiacetal dehydrogenase